MNAAVDRDEIQELGNSLRPINQHILKKDTEIQRVWYQGGESYFDIFFDIEDNEIVWFQFTLRGKTLSWDKNQPGIQTGRTNELTPDEVSYYPASKLIEMDSKPDLAFIELAQAILQTRASETLFAQALGLFKQKV